MVRPRSSGGNTVKMRVPAGLREMEVFNHGNLPVR
jgi:hypothetical protein